MQKLVVKRKKNVNFGKPMKAWLERIKTNNIDLKEVIFVDASFTSSYEQSPKKETYKNEEET